VSTAPSHSEPQTPDFEQALAELESIIQRIESGQIGLEKSITEYERGVGLIRRCRQVLERAEQRVEELTSQMQSERPAQAVVPSRPGTDARGAPTKSTDETPF
jgi:exodeoxyribonuclease VII small subunit